MRFFTAVFLACLAVSCTTLETGPQRAPDAGSTPAVAASRPRVERSAVDTRTLPAKKQNELAYEAFKKMLETPAGTDRKALTQFYIDGYERIIREYPASSLAQEGSWKIVRMYLRDFQPAKIDEAEAAYRRFARRYPESFLLDDALTELLRYFGNRGRWDRVVVYTAPMVRQRMIKAPPMILVYYGEGNYRIGRRDEAILAYSLAAKRLPHDSFLFKKAIERLKELDPSKILPEWQAPPAGVARAGRALAGRTVAGPTVAPSFLRQTGTPGVRTFPPKPAPPAAGVSSPKPPSPPRSVPPPLPGRTLGHATARRP